MSYELGLDRSGNGNNWTVNNMTLAADQMLDTPTNNFCTFNPLARDAAMELGEGNLRTFTTSTGGMSIGRATFGVSSGKWYWEYVMRGVIGSATAAATEPGIMDERDTDNKDEDSGMFIGKTVHQIAYYAANGNKYNNNASSSYGDSYGNGDIIGTALDMDAGTITFYKNNVSQGVALTGLTGTKTPAIADDS